MENDDNNNMIDSEQERQQLLELPDDDNNFQLSTRAVRAPQAHRNRKLDFDHLILDDVEEDEISVDMTAQIAAPSDGAPVGATSAGATSTGVRLQDEELLAFVGVYFKDEFMSLDAYHVKHSTNPEINRHGSRIVWIENTQTGQMIAVPRRGDTGAGDRNEGGDGDGSVDGDDKAGDLEAAVNEADETSGLSALIPPPPPPWDDLIMATDDTEHADNGTGSNKSLGKSSKELEDDVLKPIVSYHNLAMVQRAIFLLFQGTLAGFSFTTIFGEQAAGDSDAQYLVYYQPNAYEYRRFFYILTTVSLIGSLDLCLTIINSRRERSGHGSGGALDALSGGRGSHGTASYQRAFFALNLNYGTASLFFAVAIALLYFIAFFCSLLMAPTDTRIFIRNGSEAGDEDWASDALEDGDFSESLDRWRSLDFVRLISSLGAWLGSCAFVWKDLTQLNYRTADLYRLRENTLAWNSRVREMEGGEGLEKLRPAALKRLITVLRVGLDRAKNALSFYQKQQQD